ncbi:MAG: SDR family NAD(P)-dependent oxidoreductase [Fidelibacterota bacterium]
MERQKIALVTGASRGIGTYIVDTLIKQGYFVIGVARHEPGLRKALHRHGPENFDYFIQDLQEIALLEQLVQAVREKYSYINVLVNNAGIERYDYYQNNSRQLLEKIIHVNLMAPMELTRLFLPDFLQHGGAIINIASLGGKKGIAYNSIYSATKAGILMWCDGLRQELVDSGTSITVICPGYIAETGMFYDGGVPAPALLGTSPPQAVADAVMTAIREQKAEIIVNSGPIRPLLALGQIWPVLGDKIVRWFGVPSMSKKRIQNSGNGK